MWESVKKSWKGADQKSPGWQGQSVMDMLTGSQGIVGSYEAWVSQDWWQGHSWEPQWTSCIHRWCWGHWDVLLSSVSAPPERPRAERFPLWSHLQRGLWVQSWGPHTPGAALYPGACRACCEEQDSCQHGESQPLGKEQGKGKPSSPTCWSLVREPMSTWMPSGMEGCSEIPRLAGDLQVLQVVGYLTEGEQIQKNFTELSKWTNMWQMNFSKEKYCVSIGGNYLYDAEPGTAQEVVWHHQLRVPWQLKHAESVGPCQQGPQSQSRVWASLTPLEHLGHMQFLSLHLKKEAVSHRGCRKMELIRLKGAAAHCMRRDFWKVWGLHFR